MKKSITHFPYRPLMAVVFLQFFLYTGCNGPLLEQKREFTGTNNGLVLINLGDHGRTVMSPAGIFKTYTFSFESPGKETVTVNSDGKSLRLELEAGIWALTVAEIVDIGGEQEEAARGTVGFEVKPGISNSVTVNLAAQFLEGIGTLRYTVSFPNVVSEGEMILSPLSGGGDIRIDLLSESILSGATMTKTAVQSLDSGYYFLTIELYESNGTLEKIDVVHIYKDRETTISGGYAFATADFVSTKPYSAGSGQTLLAALNAIASDSSSKDFTITMNGDETAFAPFTLSTANYNGKRITIRGKSYQITMAGGSLGSLFTIEKGVTFVLQDLTLRGKGLTVENRAPLVSVQGGNLVLKEGAFITGNYNNVYSSSGGGVSVSGGTFTMYGGEISGNINSQPDFSNGGGVRVSGGTFTMYGGEISGNTATSETGYSQGGGVYIYGGTFTMHGGSISGNTSTTSSSEVASHGGGVYVDSMGTFIMHGGQINGNNSTGSFMAEAGGVYVDSMGTFTMNGGEICGNTVSAPNANGGGVAFRGTSFTMNGGDISGNTVSSSSGYGGGGGVYANNYGTFTMNGGRINGNTAGHGGGVVIDSVLFAMSGSARIAEDNAIYLRAADESIHLPVNNFTSSGVIAVIDLEGTVDGWLTKNVLTRDATYSGSIPLNRFKLGNFVSDWSTKTPIAGYVLDEEGRLQSE